ncbi:hypothetical protein FGO68_gene3168 [Halteria grandinella]|uniref:Uncharacterized protein n=1 Tax=Halteria grandinella TaxID=5974 RepID=A0A8J8T4V2_HALGN|nr:hypothetical protein FGO68_gene3168 [Halteria grandinella]
MTPSNLIYQAASVQKEVYPIAAPQLIDLARQCSLQLTKQKDFQSILKLQRSLSPEQVTPNNSNQIYSQQLVKRFHRLLQSLSIAKTLQMLLMLNTSLRISISKNSPSLIPQGSTLKPSKGQAQRRSMPFKLQGLLRRGQRRTILLTLLSPKR